jgi:molecular chaperone DnaJ
VVRKDVCGTCNGKGIHPGSSRTTCPVCKGSGKTEQQSGFMKFASPCQNCGGSGSLPGNPCTTCGGDGRVDKVARIRAKIPAGVDDQSKVRLPGKGNAGRFGGPTGDLIITIRVTPHKFFVRHGPHLEIVLPVTYAEAALGAKIEVPTLEGKALLKVPPAVQSGSKLRLKGKGIYNPKTRSKGDMIVEVKIVPPPTKDLKVRELLRQIEEVAPYHPREKLGR